MNNTFSCNYYCFSYELVQVSTLELRVEQLEEQTNRLSHQSTVEDGKVDGAVKEEREHLRKQLSEVIKQKEEIADKVFV